jgi:hypothetical protein
MVDSGLFVPGAQVVLEAPLATLPRAISVIRGLHPQRYLILDPPSHKGMEVRFEAGVDLLVRLIKGDKVALFRSKSLGRLQGPAALLLVMYPETVEYGQIRRGKSFPVLFDATLGAGDGAPPAGQAEPCLILNLSEDGCMLQCESPQPFGARIPLSFVLPEIGSVTSLCATVKSCQRRDPSWELEVVFSFEDQEHARQIQDYLHLLDQRQLESAMLRLSSLD